MVTRKTKRKLKALFSTHWDTFVRKFPVAAPDYIRTTISKFLACRTEALGCHVFKCLICGFTLLIKHACKTRFCSSCATAYIDKWAAKIKYWLSFINANYYFITFTIPKKLELIVKVNKRLLYNALFKSASYAILSFYKEKRVTAGIISILHTFGRTLNFHPHVHLLCTIGGLLFNHSAWKEVFLPAKVLQARFKKHFTDTLRKHYKNGEIILPDELRLDSFSSFDKLLKNLEKKHWQLKRKGALDAVTAALEYIARYLGKPPISENRILWFNHNKICFTYKNYLNKAVTEKYFCSIDEFFFRLIQHVPLPRFPMVRFYGLFSCRNKKNLMEIAAKLIPPPLGAEILRVKPPKTCREHRLYKTGKDLLKCPNCNIDLEKVMVYFPGSLRLTSFAELLKSWQETPVDNTS